jgi:RimJ/RimL family protein N-acetyltransferase
MLGPRDTARLHMLPWTAEHTPALTAINAQPEVTRFLGLGAPMTAAESRAQSQRFAEHWDTYGFGLWALVEKDSGATVGFTGLSHPVTFTELAGEVEVGWRLDRAAWGRGYATEAGREALRAGLEELGLPELISIIHPANAASLAVARRLGLRPGRHVLDRRTQTRLEVLVTAGAPVPPTAGA